MARIAANMASDNVAITGLEELDAHLDSLIDDPSLDTQRPLFDHVELQLTESNIPALIPRLLPKITSILQVFQHDPAVLCSLAVRLLKPLALTHVLSLASEESLILAMRSPAPSANLLAMSVVAKGSRSPADAAILAVMKPLMTAFVDKWLSSPFVEVGEQGSKILGNLLDTDCELGPQDIIPSAALPVASSSSSSTTTTTTNGISDARAVAMRNARLPGQGLAWRRILQDRDIYSLILAYSSSNSSSHASETPPPLDEKQRTLAQGRLFRVLPRLAALNLAAVTRSDFTDLHRQYSSSSANTTTTTTTTTTTSSPSDDRGPSTEEGGGLLHYVALHMIDKEDILMHLSLIDFFETLVSIQAVLPYSSYRNDTIRRLVARAAADDAQLRQALQTLPERTVPEEADELSRFLQSVL